MLRLKSVVWTSIQVKYFRKYNSGGVTTSVAQELALWAFDSSSKVSGSMLGAINLAHKLF